MRVAILSESPADEAALRILVDAALGVTTTVPTGMPPLRNRGWPGVRDVFPAVVRQLHFKTAADGIFLVVDSNHASVVENSPKNRLIELRQMVATLRKELKPVGGYPPIKIAVGVASPAIEAWLLCREHGDISEAAWEQGLAAQRDPYSKLALKKRLYGVDKPSLALATDCMVKAAHVIGRELPLLEARFPNGFGSMMRELRSWRTLA